VCLSTIILSTQHYHVNKVGVHASASIALDRAIDHDSIISSEDGASCVGQSSQTTTRERGVLAPPEPIPHAGARRRRLWTRCVSGRYTPQVSVSLWSVATHREGTVTTPDAQCSGSHNNRRHSHVVAATYLSMPTLSLLSPSSSKRKARMGYTLPTSPCSSTT
jgi:hypothetical protein